MLYSIKKPAAKYFSAAGEFFYVCSELQRIQCAPTEIAGLRFIITGTLVAVEISAAVAAQSGAIA